LLLAATYLGHFNGNILLLVAAHLRLCSVMLFNLVMRHAFLLFYQLDHTIDLSIWNNILFSFSCLIPTESAVVSEFSSPCRQQNHAMPFIRLASLRILVCSYSEWGSSVFSSNKATNSASSFKPTWEFSHQALHQGFALLPLSCY
jgi:hypothetical protein